VADSRPLQLILARNLLSSLSTPAFLVDADGNLLFFNDAAGALLGRRYEETGQMTDVWTATFGPFDEGGSPIPYDQVPLTTALRGNRPSHGGFRIRSAGGVEHAIEASALPLVGDQNFHGAIVVFWPKGGSAGEGGS
jgi:PAS domain-containing protein